MSEHIPQLRAVVVFVALMSVISGCSTSGSFHSVRFGPGEIAVEDGQFHMDGQIGVGTGAAPHQNFSDVTVVLYDADKGVIERVSVGALSTSPSYGPTARTVNITTDRVPTYVVIDSRDFWTGQTEVHVEGYELVNGSYRSYPLGQNRTFPSD